MGILPGIHLGTLPYPNNSSGVFHSKEGEANFYVALGSNACSATPSTCFDMVRDNVQTAVRKCQPAVHESCYDLRWELFAAEQASSQ
jgi:hypothetical protein